jgi:hypothetical protein
MNLMISCLLLDAVQTGFDNAHDGTFDHDVGVAGGKFSNGLP